MKWNWITVENRSHFSAVVGRVSLGLNVDKIRLYRAENVNKTFVLLHGGSTITVIDSELAN